MQRGLSEGLLDDKWKALEEAQVVVWDLAQELQQHSEQWLSLGLSAVPGNSASRSSCKQRSELAYRSKSQVGTVVWLFSLPVVHLIHQRHHMHHQQADTC